MAQDHRAVGRGALEVREAVAAGLRGCDDLAVVREVEARSSSPPTSTVEQPRPPPRRGRAPPTFVSADRDHVAAPVAVEPHGPDRLADLQVRVRLDDALGRQHGLEAADPR